jgi:hypothetical protein
MQVNFSDSSMAELRQLSPVQLLEVLEVLGDLRPEQFQGRSASDSLGKITRQGKTFFRVRIGGLRFYFEFVQGGIFCHHILPKHSFEDFCFRCGFPVDGRGVEQEESFWEFLIGK